jgi:hypothetical protein
MARDDDKGQPVSLEPDDPIRVVLARAAAGDVDENLKIVLRVSGGMPAQSYRFDYRVGGDLTARVSLDDERSNRRRAVDGASVERNEVAELARELVASGVLDVPADPPRFLPDTVVGVLEISYGKATFRVYFAADPEQASVQEVPPRPELHRAAEAIYVAAGALMDERSPGP